MSLKIACALLLFGLALLELGSAELYRNNRYYKPFAVQTIPTRGDSGMQCYCPCADTDVYTDDNNDGGNYGDNNLSVNPVALHELDRLGATRPNQGQYQQRNQGQYQQQQPWPRRYN